MKVKQYQRDHVAIAIFERGDFENVPELRDYFDEYLSEVIEIEKPWSCAAYMSTHFSLECMIQITTSFLQGLLDKQEELRRLNIELRPRHLNTVRELRPADLKAEKE